jgi:hypothetical protein
MSTANYPTRIILDKQQYVFAIDDDELFLGSERSEVYTLEVPITIPVINSTGRGKWAGSSLTIGHNLFVLRDWFRRRSAKDTAGILLFDFSNPLGEELCLYVVDNSLSGRPLADTLADIKASKANLVAETLTRGPKLSDSGPIIEHLD